ncbi:M28 family peptidase [Pseudoalteromonas sp. Hal040]|uniref:M28 family peptidase n=1 Tax=unclassified Pseudoalteromonas TaxID=194690 RepID=UPI00301CBF04
MKVNYKRFARIQLSLLITSSALLLHCGQAFANTNLEQDVVTLTSAQFAGRKTATQGAQLAAEFISERFISLGYTVDEQTFAYQSGLFGKAFGRNVVATKSSHCEKCEKIIFTAHYDHLGQKGSRLYPGANDNASGVAALLYLASYFAEKPKQYQLVFVATDAEENGLHGSEYLVSTLNKDEIKLNINLDMLVVNPRKPRIYAFLDNQSLAQYQTDIKTLSDKQITFMATSSSARLNRLFDLNVDWRRASDHYSFAKVGIPYIYFGIGHDKHHHQSTDTTAHMDFTLFESAMKKIAEFVEKLPS